MERPTPAQRQWQRIEQGMFLHFGVNTFNHLEWSDGTLSPESFNPDQLDVRQWVETAKAAGFGYMILTAKHHDGFCLWPTETTDYSIANSPYQGGKGDIVGDLAQACHELGMPLGLYLSPWDRHEPCYSDPEAYDRFYTRQLTELCTRYGPLFEIWFDGAGSAGRVYNWEAIMAVVQRYQPQALVFNMGAPTIRWVGNEDGFASDPNYYVVSPKPAPEMYTAAYLADRHYCPPECDVSLRKGWFWHPDELPTVKSLDHLLWIYYHSVGLGANLLLNVPPDRHGLIDSADRARLLELHAELQRRFATPQIGKISQDGAVVSVQFANPITFDHLVLEEDLADGQQIDGYTIQAEGATLAQGITVGHKKIHVFPAQRTEQLTITLSSPTARLSRVTAYHTGHEAVPAPAAD